MALPQLERPDSDDEVAYQVQMKIRSAAEEQRMFENFTQGDYLGLEDGRPGVSIGPDLFGGVNVYMPYSWQLILWLCGVAVIALLAFGTRACVGEERTQQILHGGSAAAPAEDAPAP